MFKPWKVSRALYFIKTANRKLDFYIPYLAIPHCISGDTRQSLYSKTFTCSSMFLITCHHHVCMYTTPQMLHCSTAWRGNCSRNLLQSAHWFKPLPVTMEAAWFSLVHIHSGWKQTPHTENVVHHGKYKLVFPVRSFITTSLLSSTLYIQLKLQKGICICKMSMPNNKLPI